MTLTIPSWLLAGGVGFMIGALFMFAFAMWQIHWRRY